MSRRERPVSLSTRFALCAFVAALSGACKSADPRTQVMLVVDAEEQVRARATELTVAFESRSEFDHIDGTPNEQTFSTTEGAIQSWPYSIALSPRGNDARRSYRITATLYEGETAIAVLRARSGFVAQQTLELRLLFSADCLDKNSLSCSDHETCQLGDCLSSEIDASSLPALGGDGQIVAAADGGIPNASSGIRTSSQRRAEGGTGGEGGMSAPGRRGGGGSASDAADGGTMNEKPGRVVGGNCGDGVWNDEEECDTAIAQGMPGACPTSCTVTDGCKPLQLEGTACKTRCMEYPVQSAIAGDNCCLPGTDANSDPDCATVAICGNGVVEMGELCDGDCPTDPAACARSNECKQAKIVGDAASCSAQCSMFDIEVCMTGDGCCGTSGCTHETDAECSPSCGNGIVEEALGELCEPTSAERPCPSCNDGDACTDDITTGTPENCNVRCDHTPITRTVNGDMCCPTGRGNANNDSDCQAMCGNGIVERGELCDGLCPTQASQCEDFIACTSNGLAASACGMRCNFTPILSAANGDGCCPVGANANNDSDCAPACGNLVVERGEVCDGNCPTSCPADTDNNACTANVVAGTGCQRRCESRPLTANTRGIDGCCPSGADHTTDSDCAPPACAAPREMCGSECVNTQGSQLHCGTCSNACADNQLCMNGTCQVTDCSLGNGRCAGPTSDCVPLNTNSNCGGCGVTCNQPETCNGTKCEAPACPPGNDYCGGTSCVPLNTSLHCGTCSTKCTMPEECTSTGCQAPEPPACPTGSDYCGGTSCVPLNTSSHCGTCNTTCTSSERCTGARCQACPTGSDYCGGATCVELNTSSHCGTCTSRCTSPEVCNGTKCEAPACPPGSDYCGETSCVPLNTRSHCGSCGNDCRGDLACLGSSCGCTSGTQCGTSCCGAGQVCNGSTCETPTPDPPADLTPSRAQ